jgi:hypothetical protein
MRRFASLLGCCLLAHCGGQTTTGTGDGGGMDRYAPDSIPDVPFDAGPRTHTDWVAFCEAFTGCGMLNIAGMTSEMTFCVSLELYDNAYTPIAACFLVGGRTCPELQACADNGNPSPACPIDGGQAQACMGSISVGCDMAGRPFAQDCSKTGQTCSVPAGGCTSGSCSGGNFCLGSDLFDCEMATKDAGVGGLIESCDQQGGSSCGPGEDGGATCIGPGPTCASDRCDQAMLVLCQGGHEARYDCPGFGLACLDDKDPDSYVSGGGFFCGLGTECGSDYTDSCHGSTLSYCNAGEISTLDCAATGWKTCVNDGNGTRCSE